jgi:peptidase A4-like protein
MESRFWFSGASALLFGVLAAGPAVAQQAGPPAGSVPPYHRPMEAYRNPDGSIMRNPRNQVVSTEWSGYAVTTWQPYSSASAIWQVPEATYDGGKTPYGYEYVSNWVGIGGYGDATLIQLGSYSYVSTSGVAGYSAWFELYPAVSQTIPHAVRHGDIISASLQCTAACTPSSVQTWKLTMTDETAGWTWTQSFQYQSSMRSAEWIAEAPWENGVLPLADYGQATFDPVTANGSDPNLSLSANSIVMSDQWGETSNASAPASGDWFSTCWGKAPSYTPCTAGSFSTPPPVVTASLAANPTSISAGQSSTLSWTSTNATSCTGSNFSASATSGSAIVSPSVTTSYSVTCTDGADPATAMATITVSSTVNHKKK